MDTRTDPTRGREGCRGATLVELAFVAFLIPLMLGIGVMTLRSSGTGGKDVVDASMSMDKLRALLRRIGDELLCSGQAGEDTNGNGVLDPGEDLNGNERLEKDWAVTASSVRFNRVLADGSFSLPITYSLQTGELMRSELQPDGQTLNAAVAGRVLAFSVLSTGNQIAVSLSVGASASPQTSSIAVQQRN